MGSQGRVADRTVCVRVYVCMFMQTPIRDELGLNDADSLALMGTPGVGKRREQSRLAALRSELRAGLSALPAPQNEYQVSILPGIRVNQPVLYVMRGCDDWLRDSHLRATSVHSLSWRRHSVVASIACMYVHILLIVLCTVHILESESTTRMDMGWCVKVCSTCHHAQVVVPDAPMDDDGDDMEGIEEDASEARARRLKQEEERRQQEEKKKSKVRHVIQSVYCI